MKKGHLFVLSGPSGTGKGSICKRISSLNNACLSVSMTTREPREYETEGESYYFVERDEFLDVVSNGGFLEYAQVYGSMYGTPKGPVLNALQNGEDIILEIDIQGALEVKKSYPDGVFIFILPPSLAELEGRLRRRGTETEESIRMRLSKTVEELSHIDQYDYYVINDDLESASKDVASIMKSEHMLVDEYTDQVIKLIKNKETITNSRR